MQYLSGDWLCMELMTEGFRDQMEISGKVSQNGKSACTEHPADGV